MLGEENFGWLVTFTGRQARLADDEARHNELAEIKQRSFRYPKATAAAANYLLVQAREGRGLFWHASLQRAGQTSWG